MLSKKIKSILSKTKGVGTRAAKGKSEYRVDTREQDRKRKWQTVNIDQRLVR